MFVIIGKKLKKIFKVCICSFDKEEGNDERKDF